MKADLDRSLADGVAAGDLPGVVAVAFDGDGLTYEGVAGSRTLGEAQSMTPDTIFDIYSMTKPLVAALAMRLVERGELALDEPASAVCPTLAEARVLTGFDGDGRARLRVPSASITLRHLLSHTSGIVYEVWNHDFAAYAQGLPAAERADLTAALAPPVLMFDPGQHWEYGSGYEWVARMIENTAGASLDVVLREELLDPLAMAETSYSYALTEEMQARAAGVHERLPDGSLVSVEIPTRTNAPRGSGGLVSTVHDYARFCRMILGRGVLDGQRVLEDETVCSMCSNAIGEHRVRPLRSTMPRFSRDAEFFPGEPKGWGLGFQVGLTRCATGRAAGTQMWAGLANTYFWIDVQSRIGGVFAAQLFPFLDSRALARYLDFEARIYRG